MGFQPTEVNIIGQALNPNQKREPIARLKRSCWEYEVVPKPEIDFETVMLKVLKKIPLLKLKKLKEKMPDIEFGFTYVVYWVDSLPGIFFDEKTIEKLAEYGMYINIDLIQTE